MIKHTSFDHSGGFYFYRLHNWKTDQLTNGFPSLKNFLNSMFDSCPHDYFHAGPRSSALKFSLNDVDMHQITGHEVSQLTIDGLEANHERYKTAHSKVQVFMLENDDKTLAVEVPIWLKADELKNYSNIFKSEEPLTGHIDVLRMEGDKVWIWDYKPNAKREKYASTQVFFYALMMSKRTGIPLNHFRCGYFDSAYSFIFKPEMNMLKMPKLKSFLDK